MCGDLHHTPNLGHRETLGNEEFEVAFGHRNGHFWGSAIVRSFECGAANQANREALELPGFGANSDAQRGYFERTVKKIFTVIAGRFQRCKTGTFRELYSVGFARFGSAGIVVVSAVGSALGSTRGDAITCAAPGSGRSAEMKSPMSRAQHRGQFPRTTPRTSVGVAGSARPHWAHRNSETRAFGLGMILGHRWSVEVVAGLGATTSLHRPRLTLRTVVALSDFGARHRCTGPCRLYSNRASARLAGGVGPDLGTWRTRVGTVRTGITGDESRPSAGAETSRTL